jgi:hypothetical protein
MFPMTILEAFSNGLPVICSDLPSLRGLVEPHVTGINFPQGDADALAGRVMWAISNSAALEEQGRRAHAIYEDRYTPEVNFNQLMGIYRGLMSHPEGSRGAVAQAQRRGDTWSIASARVSRGDGLRPRAGQNSEC